MSGLTMDDGTAGSPENSGIDRRETRAVSRGAECGSGKAAAAGTWTGIGDVDDASRAQL